MSEPSVGNGVSDQADCEEFEDVEWELCCSSRETSVGCVFFANPDSARAAMEFAHARAGSDRSAN